MYKLFPGAALLVGAVIPVVAMADIRLLVQFSNGTQSVEQRIQTINRNPVVREAVQNSAGSMQFLEMQLRRSSPHALWYDREGNLLKRQSLRDPRLMHYPRNTMADKSENLSNSVSEAATITTTNQGVILVSGPDEAVRLEIYLPEIAHFELSEETWQFDVL